MLDTSNNTTKREYMCPILVPLQLLLEVGSCSAVSRCVLRYPQPAR